MSELPKRLLKDVVWMLRPILYTDREELAAAVRDYHMAIVNSDERWRPHERVLAARRITLCFECWEGDDEFEIELELETQDPEGWTTLDLLFAVHQRVADHLTSDGATLGDHCFFEGLSLRSASDDPPSYYLNLGS
jgi:hypothetical protein